MLETGALGPVYTEMKRANHFAAALADVLTASTTLKDDPLIDQIHKTGLVTYGRSDGATSIVFFKRRYGDRPFPITHQPTGQRLDVTVGDGIFRHIVSAYPLTPKTSLALSVSQIFTIQKLEGRVVIVVYAPHESETGMIFALPGKPKLGKGGGATLAKPAGRITLHDVYRATETKPALTTHRCDGSSKCGGCVGSILAIYPQAPGCWP